MESANCPCSGMHWYMCVHVSVHTTTMCANMSHHVHVSVKTLLCRTTAFWTGGLATIVLSTYLCTHLCTVVLLLMDRLAVKLFQQQHCDVLVLVVTLSVCIKCAYVRKSSCWLYNLLFLTLYLALLVQLAVVYACTYVRICAWSFLHQCYYARSIPGFWAAQTTRQLASGTGSPGPVSVCWRGTTTMSCVPSSTPLRTWLPRHHWTRPFECGTFQVSSWREKVWEVELRGRSGNYMWLGKQEREMEWMGEEKRV